MPELPIADQIPTDTTVDAKCGRIARTATVAKGAEGRGTTMTIRANLPNTRQVKTKTPDGRDLIFLTGTGVVDYAGTTTHFTHDSLAIHLSPPDGPIWSGSA